MGVKVMLILCVILAAILGSACARPPREEMEAAKAAIQEARRAEADRYAPDRFKAAQDALVEAQAKLKAKDYKAAEQQALLAKERADAAKRSAKAKRARAKLDAQAMLSRAQEAVGVAKAMVDSAVAFGAREANFAGARADLDTSLTEVQRAFDERDFRGVMERAKTVEEKADKLQKEARAAAEEAVLRADPHDPNEVAVIQTKMGRIVFEFFSDDAPNHAANFKKLAKLRFYNGTTFHRVIPGFMIQGGDPNTKDDDRSNDGMGGPGYTIKAEFNRRPHLRGTVSMARGPDPDSAGSQFFICVAPQPHLNGNYTLFGQVIEGMEVVDRIVDAPKNRRDNPLERIEMRVSIVDRSVVSRP